MSHQKRIDDIIKNIEHSLVYHGISYHKERLWTGERDEKIIQSYIESLQSLGYQVIHRNNALYITYELQKSKL